MTIDWTRAPPWARFVAVGPYGSIWYELEPVLIYADPPHYAARGGGQWKRISYVSRNACLYERPVGPQEASDAT